MIKFRCFFCAVVIWGMLFCAMSFAQTPTPNPFAETMTQVATINSLMAGNYDGTVPFAEVKKHGDFGLGTFHSLDGEMIMLDGKIYQARIDGKIHEIPDSDKTPFAAVTFFDTDEKLDLGAITLDDLKKRLNETVASNLFYAIRVEGEFEMVKVRSVISQKPYPRLDEAVKNQAVFEKSNIRGTLVGLYYPEFVNGLNVPGYHFHFLSDDKNFGGHVLNAAIKKATVRLDKTPAFHMILPDDFTPGGSKEGDIEKIESKGK